MATFTLSDVIDIAERKGEALMAVDVDPHEQFLAWGLRAIETEGELI